MMENRKKLGHPVRAILFKPELNELSEIEIYNDETLVGVFSTSTKGALTRDQDRDSGMFECCKIESGLNSITDSDAFLYRPLYVTIIVNSCGESFALKERVIFAGELVNHKFTSIEMSIEEIKSMIESVNLIQ
jgi:hypothetical protein